MPPAEPEFFTPGSSVSRLYGTSRGERKRSAREIRELAREFCPAAIHRLAYVAEYSQDDKAVVASCRTLLEYGVGKPPVLVAGDEDGGPIKHVHATVRRTDLEGLSEEELERRLAEATARVEESER